MENKQLFELVSFVELFFQDIIIGLSFSSR